MTVQGITFNLLHIDKNMWKDEKDPVDNTEQKLPQLPLKTAMKIIDSVRAARIAALFCKPKSTYGEERSEKCE